MAGQRCFSFHDGVLALFLALPALVLSPPAEAAKIVTIDVRGAWSTNVNDINGAGAAVGQWARQFGSAHCFVRDPAGKITKFSPDPLGTRFCSASGIDEDGNVAGDFYSHRLGGKGFLRDAAGNVTLFSAGSGLDGTHAEGIDKGVITGWVLHCQPECHDTGYVRKADGSIETFNVVPGLTTDATAIRDGWVAGDYVDQTGFAGNGFIRDPKGQITTFVVPGAMDINCTGINSSQTIVGYFTLESWLLNAFVRAPDGTITIIDLTNGVDSTWASGINDRGEVVGGYSEKGVAHGFIRRPDGTLKVFDVSGAASVAVGAVSKTSWIGGTWTDGNTRTHGYIRVP